MRSFKGIFQACIRKSVKRADTLQLENKLGFLLSVLGKVLTEALQPDIFSTVASTPNPESLQECLQVLQDYQAEETTVTQLQLASSISRRTMAVVDRSADLACAARDIVRARFAFGSNSPYAPDVVLVNEFVAKEFMDLVLRAAIPYVTSGPHDKGPMKSQEDAQVNEALNSLKSNKDWRANIITKGDTAAIIELNPNSKKNAALLPKNSAPIFAITKITSPDHAIDMIAKSGRLNAAYYFAEPAHAQYLNQFIASDVSFINHIPPRLLLGPVAPSHKKFDLEMRYAVEHFSRPSPAFISPPGGQEELNKALNGDKETLQALIQDAMLEIKEKRRAEWIARGFFEQGIFIGLGLYGIPILSCIGASLFYGVRLGLRKWGAL